MNDDASLMVLQAIASSLKNIEKHLETLVDTTEDTNFEVRALRKDMDPIIGNLSEIASNTSSSG